MKMKYATIINGLGTASKYKNQKVTINGMNFDSRKEYRRWCELRLLEKSGEIKNLRRQVKYELIPPINGFPRATYYIADFVYDDIRVGHTVVEDCKGFKTDVYKLKKKLMLFLKGIDIFET